MDPNSPLAHTKHVFRVGFLFLLGIVALVAIRTLAMPDSWGEFGPYRGDSVAEYHVLPVIHGGPASCAECHEDEAAVHDEGSHRPVNCELCHGPVARHVADGSVIAAMPVTRSAKLCLTCHATLAARPAGFPQIDGRTHVEENGEEWSESSCFTCHDPHSPL